MLLLEQFGRWHNDLFLVFFVESLSLLAIQLISVADPQNAIYVEIRWRLVLVRDLEGPLNSELLALNFEDLCDFLAHAHKECLLRLVIDYCANGPHDSILEDHVKALSDLILLNSCFMNALLKAVLIGQNPHDFEQGGSNLGV